MTIRWLTLLENLQEAFWFIPALMSFAAVVMAVFLVQVDLFVDVPLETILPISNDPDGARTMMSTIASAFLGIAASLFSITLVAMTLASQQFGPRLLGNFMRDRTNQTVLATFIGTAIYCLLVLWSIQDDQGATFVPQLAVAGGIVWAAFGLGMFIYFIHHIAESIRLSQLVAAIGDDFDVVLGRMYPKMIGESASTAVPLGNASIDKLIADFHPIESSRSGYVQSVNGERLMQLAVDHDLIVVLNLRPGQFMSYGQVVAYAGPREGELPPELTEAIEQGFLLGNDRSQVQDIDFLFEKLAEIGIRAMSPGVNDPYTAVMCLDRIGAGLSRVVAQELATSNRYDTNGTLRVIARETTTLDGLMSTSFEQLRYYAASDLSVLSHMLHVLTQVTLQTNHPDHRDVLREHIARTQHYIEQIEPQGWDKRNADEAYKNALAALEP